MYLFFPDNYPWSMAALMALNAGGAIADVDDACRPLIPVAGANDDSANEAWYESWTRVAERAQRLAEDDAAAGHAFSAARKYLRAAAYFMNAERMMKGSDPRRVMTYRRMLAMFRAGVMARGDRLEWVDIPYGDTTLPALYVPPSHPLGDGPAPCMIHFDGLDVMKEFLYMGGVAAELGRRGIGTLLVDHPGIGEALRLQGLTLFPETEQPAAACVDWLEKRDDVDAARIGIMAISLGGYYAPRAACYEPRLACCVAWGAIWDYGEVTEGRLKGSSSQLSVSHWAEHMMWVFGQPTMDDVVAVTKSMTLEGHMANMRCPLLVVHGANDRQIPLKMAEATVAAATNSPRAELRVFETQEGGIEHCQVDVPQHGVDFMTDWIADVLGGRRAAA